MRKSFLMSILLMLICLTVIFGNSCKNTSQNIENPYFFKQGVTEQIYSCRYDDIKDYGNITVTLHINKLFEVDDGVLYKLKLDTAIYDDEDRITLGYFYVQKDKIYKIIPDDINIVELKTNSSIIKISDIVCQDEEIKDDLGEEAKGWHSFMLADGEMKEYHRYNNAVESGYYEHFIWEYDKGLVGYKRGWGAERENIELQILNN